MTSRHDLFDSFFDGYVKCAMWTEEDELDGAVLSPECREKMRADCKRFFDANRGDILAGSVRAQSRDSSAQEAGHDFWLTRNRHGAGFWDGGWPEPAASRLTKSAKSFGEVWLYVGDDGLVYC